MRLRGASVILMVPEEQPLGFIRRLAEIILEQNSQEKEFEIVLDRPDELRSLKTTLEQMGYGARVVMPGDRLHITCP
jgi:hypothetical protein